LIPALAGANLIYGLGMVESGMTFDFGQLVMDNEFAKMIRQVVGGIPVNDQTLAVDVTKEVGPFKDFLSHKSTFEHMRSQSQPKLMDRRAREKWTASGSKPMQEKALEEARRILETHQPDQLSDEVKKKIRAVVEQAEAEMGVKGENND
jgi:trimethylamine---corrinoid protein Co-methyltransferase